MSVFLVIIFSLISLKSEAFTPEVIYGPDHRLEPYQVDVSSQILVQSTAVRIHHSQIRQRGNKLIISGQTLFQKGVCPQERFAHQQAAGSCSGFLVAKDILITAGHCMELVEDCQNYAWVFDYQVQNDSQSTPHVARSKAYRCKQILERKMQPTWNIDYAVIQLEQEIKDREPLSFRVTGEIKRGEPLFVIGYPNGLPAKIAAGANVRNTFEAYFKANLDTFSGNSGSPVFNANTGIVEGILTAGESDYENVYTPVEMQDVHGNKWTEQKLCKIPRKCDDLACRGEDVTKITEVLYPHNY